MRTLLERKCAYPVIFSTEMEKSDCVMLFCMWKELVRVHVPKVRMLWQKVPASCLSTFTIKKLTYLNYQSTVVFLQGMWLPFSNDCLWNYRICLSQRTSEDWNEIALKLSYWSFSFIWNFYPYIILEKFERVGRGMHEKRNTRCMFNNHVNALGKSLVNKKINKCMTAYRGGPFEFVGWNANDFYKE